MPPRRLLVVLLCCWSALAAHAALLEVDGVVSPAWIAHVDGRREPLEVGAAVAQGDRLITGPGARVRIRMEEGSAVRLGENAELAVEQLTAAERPGDGGARWVGAFDVERGAFRCTTSTGHDTRVERDLKFRIDAVAVGIRGTDVWGSADAARSLVVLIDGRATVGGPGGVAELAGPRAAYVVPRGGSAQPVTRVSKEVLKALAAKTEILAGAGGARRGGRSRVEALATIDETYARQQHEQLRAAGYPAQLNVVEEEGAMPVYRVDLSQIAGERDARAVVRKFKALGYPTARSTR